MHISAARFSDAARIQVRPVTTPTRGPVTHAAIPAAGAPTGEPGPVSETKGKGNLRAHGMLRKLEAGGFNGVAELRHRIKHIDALRERATTHAAGIFMNGAGGFANRISDATLEAVSGLALDESARTAVDAALDAFRGGVSDAAADVERSGSIDVDAMAGALRDLLDGLLAALGGVLAPTEAPAGADPASAPASPLDAGGTITGTGDDPFAALSSIFDGALDAFIGTVADALELPDPAPVNGHGRAYEKFLAIYEALRNGSDPVVDTTA